MAVGATAVHRQLLLLQQKLLWRIVGAALELEARLGAGVSNFTYGLAEQTLQAIASGSSSLQLSSLRALVLEHVTLCRSVFRRPGGELLAAGANLLHCAVPTRRKSTAPCTFYMQAAFVLRPVPCRLPTSSITEPPRPHVTPLHSLSLLTELGAWIGHIFFRDSLYSSLDDQVRAIHTVCTS